MRKQEIRCDVCTESCSSSETIQMAQGENVKSFDFCLACKKRLDDAFEKMRPNTTLDEKSFSLEALNLVMNQHSLSPKNILF